MHIATIQAPRVETFDGRGVLQWVERQRAEGATDADIADRYGNAIFNIPLPRIPANERDPEATAAVEQVHRATHFMRTQLGRDGWDDRGGSVSLAIRVPRPDGAPADIGSWSPFASRRNMVIGSGDAATAARSLAYDDDVIAHELGHGIWFNVINQGAGIDRPPNQMAMAIAESFGDIFAAAIDTGDWTIGESTGRPTATNPGYIRDLERPVVSHMRDVNSNVLADQHLLSGVSSLAAVRTAHRIGRTELVRIWIEAARAFTLDGDFATFAGLVIDGARRTLGTEEADRVATDWQSVGVAPATPARLTQ